MHACEKDGGEGGHMRVKGGWGEMLVVERGEGGGKCLRWREWTHEGEGRRGKCLRWRGWTHERRGGGTIFWVERAHARRMRGGAEGVRWRGCTCEKNEGRETGGGEDK